MILPIRLFLCFSILCSFAIQGMAQEICDNGIDDDQNGLIDLNDPDCDCTSITASSLIPNPSFEDMTCCPTANAMLQCAESWIQASGPTTDYVHTCDNYLGNSNIPAFAPLPFPDGEGAVGFRDGQSNVGSSYKEYVGACLTERMQVGVKYRFDFFVGFRNNVTGSQGLDLSFFGSTNCNALPFGGGSSNIGCPANTGQFVELETQFVSGNNEWVNVIIEIIPTQPYTVLIVGPACAANPNFIFDPYFYLDRLDLAEESDFGIPINTIDGSICQDGVQLSLIPDDSSTFQWYLDGVAIEGETSSSIDLQSDSSVEGSYQAVIFSASGCTTSATYELRIPPYYNQLSGSTCEGEAYLLENESFDESGFYEVTIPASDGCDSILQLTLEVLENTESTLRDTLCEGDTYTFMGELYNEGGDYEILSNNSVGCDSTIYLELEEIPNTLGVDIEDVITVEIGETVSIDPSFVDPLLTSFIWTESGVLISDNASVLDFYTVDDTKLLLVATDEYGCEELDSVQIRIDKSKLTIYMPNIFSPDGNNINDIFGPFASRYIQSVEEFAIYDRWGNQVYSANNVEAQSLIGWDGWFGSRLAATGVYGYYIRVLYIDGSTGENFGDVTLVR